MLAFLKFILATVGLTFIITHSKLFKPVRNLGYRTNKKVGDFLSCTMCQGFWAAIFVITLEKLGLGIVNLGFVGSLCAYMIFLLLKPLIDRYD
jgi:hypothetical protein